MNRCFLCLFLRLKNWVHWLPCTPTKFTLFIVTCAFFFITYNKCFYLSQSVFLFYTSFIPDPRTRQYRRLSGNPYKCPRIVRTRMCSVLLPHSHHPMPGALPFHYRRTRLAGRPGVTSILRSRTNQDVGAQKGGVGDVVSMATGLLRRWTRARCSDVGCPEPRGPAAWGGTGCDVIA